MSALGDRIAAEGAEERKILDRLVVHCPHCGVNIKLKLLPVKSIRIDSGG